MATHVSGTSHSNTAVSGFDLTYSPTAGNLLTVGILLADGSQSVLQITDNLGVDSQKIPINKWSRLGVVSSITNQRVELWGCVNVAAGVTTISATFSGSQDYEVILEEYSGATAFGPVSTFDSASVLQLTLLTNFSQNSDLMVAFFNWTNSTSVTAPSTVTLPDGNVLTNGVLRRQITAIGDGLASLDNTLPNNTIQTSGTVLMGVQAISVVISSSITLANQPGFSDIPDASWDADKPAFGSLLNKVSSNAAFGVARLEFFSGRYWHSDTVALPVSTVDGYNYQRDELIYIWAIFNTFDKSSQWITGPSCLFYAQWQVVQYDDDALNAGAVKCLETYGGSGSHPDRADSNDGELIVITVAQRRRLDIVASDFIDYSTLDPTSYAQDQPFNNEMALQLSRNSKFSAISCEVIYMGQFVNLAQLSKPVSPVDGRVYRYDECHFISSWVWTTQPDEYTQPPSGWNEAEEIKCSITSTGAVTVDSKFYNNTIIDPLDPGEGGLAYGRVAVFAVCKRALGPYFNMPSVASSFSATASSSYFMKLTNFSGVTDGNLKITFKANASGSFTITKAKLLITPKGSTTVLTAISENTLNAVTALGSQLVQVPSIAGMFVGQSLNIDTGLNAETVVVTALNGTFLPHSFHAVFTKTHLSGVTVTASTVAGPITFSSSASVTIAASQTATTDPITVTLDSINDYYLVIEVGSNVHAAQASLSGFSAKYIPAGCFSTAISGDQTGVTTIPALTNGVWFGISDMRFDATGLLLAEDFKEIDPSVFNPGSPLPASLVSQLAMNIQEGSSTPEVFGPTNYVHGATVSLPTSPIDGYSYSRAELVYLWTWHDTSPNSSIRLVACTSNIDDTGNIRLEVWRLPAGSSPLYTHEGSIDVLTIGTRANLNKPKSPHLAANPPLTFRPIDQDWGNESSTALNAQGSLAGLGTLMFTYTNTSTSITWSWGSFSVYFADGTSVVVPSGSQAFTGLTPSSTYFFGMYYDTSAGIVVVIKGTGTAVLSAAQIAFPLNGDGNVAIEVNLSGLTPASGGGSGGFGGGTRCFSGNTQVVTKRGTIAIRDVVVGDEVYTARLTWRKVLFISERAYAGPMIDMGNDELVTPTHKMRNGVKKWLNANCLWTRVVQFKGSIFNLHVDCDEHDDGSSEDTEHSYLLANSVFAHNFTTT